MSNINSETVADYKAKATPEHVTFKGTEDQLIATAAEILKRRLYRQSDALRSPDITRQFLQMEIASLDYEVFGFLCLDNQHRVISVVHAFKGTIDGAAVYPREVAREVLQHNAAAVIYFHNHPSGNPEPSQADINLTKRLKEALALLDVRSLDHIIVSGGSYTSLAERGLI